ELADGFARELAYRGRVARLALLQLNDSSVAHERLEQLDAVRVADLRQGFDAGRDHLDIGVAQAARDERDRAGFANLREDPRHLLKRGTAKLALEGALDGPRHLGIAVVG